MKKIDLQIIGESRLLYNLEDLYAGAAEFLKKGSREQLRAEEKMKEIAISKSAHLAKSVSTRNSVPLPPRYKPHVLDQYRAWGQRTQQQPRQNFSVGHNATLAAAKAGNKSAIASLSVIPNDFNAGIPDYLKNLNVSPQRKNILAQLSQYIGNNVDPRIIKKWAIDAGKTPAEASFIYNNSIFCGVTIDQCMRNIGMNPPALSAKAKAWSSFGKPTNIESLVPGDIVVTHRRGSRGNMDTSENGKGHIGIYLGVDSSGRRMMISGIMNQNNEPITIMPIDSQNFPFAFARTYE